MDAGNVVRLPGDPRRISEVWIALIERVNHRALQKLRQRNNPVVPGSELSPVIGFDKLTRKNDFIPRPMKVGQVPDREAESFQPLGNCLVATRELLRSKWYTCAHSVRVPNDRLGVIDPAAADKEVPLGPAKAGRAQERVSAETIKLFSCGEHARPGHIRKGHDGTVEPATDKGPPGTTDLDIPAPNWATRRVGTRPEL